VSAVSLLRRWSLAPLLAFVLVACGAGSASERVAAAPEATLDAGSANFTISQEITGGPAGGQTVTSEGSLDFEGRRGRVTTAVPDTGQGPAELETVFDGNLIFLRLPEGLAPTPWVRVDLDDTQGIPGLERLDQFSSDPSQSFAFLEGIVGDITEVGAEDVRGRNATHYRFTVDLERAAEAAPEDAREYVQQQIDAFGITELPTELWLDDDDRIVRQSYVLDLARLVAAGATEGTDLEDLEGEVSTTIEYFDFGTDVDVEPPPADEITDFAELVENASEAADQDG
jgi:hypothetical protein